MPRPVLILCLLLLFGGLSLSLTGHAQAPVVAEKLGPTLSEVQKLQLLNASKDVRIAQLQLEKAQQALQQLVTLYTPPGYQITDALDIVKVLEKEQAPK